MSTRALRKLQGGRKDLNLPNSCHDEEEEQDEDEDEDDRDERIVKETLLLPSKGPNRFDLLVQGSPSESEVKEDDDLSDNSDLREDGDRDGASPQPPVGSGAKRKRKKKKKRGRVKIPASSEDPTDVPDDTDVPDVEVVKVQPVAGLSRKRTRPSKKDVQDYPFNDDQLREIANYVQLHPELYDKRNEKWLNPAWKESLWKDLAQTFSNCSHQQVKKVVEKKRTDFGKIEKRESKSGSAARPRTQREQKIVEVWGFLAGHIAHENTHPSDDFGREGGDQDSSSHESVLSAHSIARRKRQKERQEEELSSPRSTKCTQESSAIQELLQSAQLLATRKPPVEGPDADIRQFVEFMYTRLKKVSPMHHGVLFSKIAYMISLMEEPVMARSAIKDPRRLLDSVPMPLGVASPSHLWQPPAPPTLAPPPPPPPPPPVYHQPQYQQTQYQQPHYSQPQYQQQQYQQPQQSEQQQFPQQPQQQQVPIPIQWESILGCSPSPVKTLQHTTTTTKLQGQKTKSPAKKALKSPMIETPKGYEAEDSDE